jgi:CheY-like chemotaxis protein
MVESGPDNNTSGYSNIILKSGQHLLSLVEDIFDTTMIETGQIKINYEKADIISVLEEVKNIIHGERLSENKTDVELILNIEKSEKTKYLVTDSRKLKQVLMNLLRNALKFTDNGSIEFGFTEIFETKNNSLQFYVKDTGIGIDKKYHETIFNIFRQVDDTHTRKFGGMGIGLSIAKKIVEMLGGRIWVESKPDEGSVFYFTIPVLPVEKDKENIIAEKELTMKSGLTDKTILIAEDEQSNFDFLKILLTRMNFKVLWAKNGREAVDICETDPSIDLVLMDVKMPLLNGYEATRMIKKKRPDLPVIAQTAYAMITDKLEADKAGCDGYLSKPIRINQLTEILEKYF